MHAATCHTIGCENEDVTVIFDEPGAMILCGPCGVEITDIDPPLPTEVVL